MKGDKTGNAVRLVDEWLATTNHLSDLFGVTTKTIQEWARKGMPQKGRNLFHLREVIRWWAGHIFRESDTNDSKSEAERRAAWAKAHAAEEANAIRRGQLMRREDVVNQWAFRVANLRSGLLALPSRLGDLLANKDISSVRVILRQEMECLLALYSEHGAFTPCPDKAPVVPSRKRGRPRKVSS